MFNDRKQLQFIELAKEHCQVLLQAAQALQNYCTSQVPATITEISQIERRGDEILTQTIHALNDTFITPYDRQDIYNLVEAIDDMIDALNNAVREIALFNITPTPNIMKASDMLVTAATEINAAVQAMGHDTAGALRHAANASVVENRMEDLYRSAVAELFEQDDFHRIFKLREIGRHLSNSADRADTIAKLIGKIVVKVA